LFEITFIPSFFFSNNNNSIFGLSRRFFILIFYYKISVLSLLVDFFFQFSFSFILKCFSFKMILIFIFYFDFLFFILAHHSGGHWGAEPSKLKKKFFVVKPFDIVSNLSFFSSRRLIEKSFISIPFEILKKYFILLKLCWSINHSITKCFFFSNRKITVKGKAMKEPKFLLWKVITRFSFVWMKCNYITSIFFHLTFLFTKYN